MNLDLDTLREMISSTLQEVMASSMNTTPEAKAAEAAQEAAEAAKAAAKEADEEAADAADATAEKERQDNLSPEPPTPSVTAESFQITKGRLRQIIAEELISAKKQGIL